MKIIVREEAQRQGLPRYYTGVPCCRGHQSERYTSFTGCVQCRKDDAKKFRKERNGYTSAWRRKNPERWIWQTTKDRAKKNNLPFDLVPEDIVIPTVCPVLGIPITTQTGGKFSANSASIDRIDNTLGYTKANIVIVSWRANRLKSDASIAEIKAIISFYENFHE